MIDELIGRITSNVGIDENLARTAVGQILAFLHKEGPQEHVGPLMKSMPGAQELVAEAGGAKAGGMMGSLMGGIGAMMGGGGVMALGTQLMGAGLSMGQIQGVSKEVFAFAEEKVGGDTIGSIVSHIPGLSQFV